MRIRPRKLNRYLVCYFKKVENEIVKQPPRIIKAGDTAEVIMIIANEIGSSEMIKESDYKKPAKTGIKYIRFKRDNLVYEGAEDLFPHKMGYFNK